MLQISWVSWGSVNKELSIKTILVTGGAGYIGSHICVELLMAGYDVVVVDNLVNSSRVALQRVENITQRSLQFYEQDVADATALETVFSKHPIDAVIHLAGLKAVGESCQQPLRYYRNNLISTMVLVELMQKFTVDKLVFSSSATVYGDPESVPVTESSPLSASNPYGQTKLMIEQMLSDIVMAEPSRLSVINLRYFNPAGAHESGLIGEDPADIPNNLLPYVSQVAAGKLTYVNVFGADYPTHDGTGVRDYIHVVDLAKGHLEALRYLDESQQTPLCRAVNLGTGKGISVLDVITTFREVTQQPIDYKITERRQGDVANCYADPSFAQQLFGWQAEKSFTKMVEDGWRWQLQNPNGYKT